MPQIDNQYNIWSWILAMTLTLGIAEMAFKLKLIHCYIFKHSYINIFLPFRGTLDIFIELLEHCYVTMAMG